MTRQQGNRRWRPRFSVRTLAIFVTLVCVYFGCWEVTKQYGVSNTTQPTAMERMMIDSPPKDVYNDVTSARSPMPFVVCQDELESHRREGSFLGMFSWNSYKERRLRRYYMWLFGPKIKLPFESEW